MGYFENNIYIQTPHQGIRNKDILNVNTSSDFCIWSYPQFTMSGASKIACNEAVCAISAQTFSTIYFVLCSGTIGADPTMWRNCGENFTEMRLRNFFCGLFLVSLVCD